MNLLVPLKLVPDLVEELTLDRSGTDLDRDALIYKVNEFDDQALEEALLLKEAAGATVTAIAVEAPDIDQALFTALAKGADEAIKVTGEFEPAVDNPTAARVLAVAIHDLQVDLVLCGVQAPDDLQGQLGVLLAGALGWPHISVVSGVELDAGGSTVRCHQEYAGGTMAQLEADLPAVLGIQAARQSPRYAAVSTVRRAMKERQLQEIPASSTEAVATGLRVRRLLPPESRGQARMLEGDVTRQVDELVAALSEQGVLTVGV